MKNKKIGVATVLLLLFILIPSTTFAQVKSNENEIKEQKEDIYSPTSQK